MKFRPVLPILLALFLQVVPLLIAALPAEAAAADSAWIAGLPKRAAAPLGSYDAVSSATTNINPPYTVTGTVGKALTSRRLTTSPQVAEAWSSAPSPPAPGVTLNSATGTITGKPTLAGVFTATITGWEFGVNSGSSTSSTFTFTFTNSVAATPPVLTNSPTGQIVTAGASPTFTSAASGTPPLFYQWQLGGTNIVAATNSLLQLPHVQVAQSGFYSVVVTNSGGRAGSSPAQLLVVPPPGPTNAPTLVPEMNSTGQIVLNFTALAGYNYQIQSAQVLGDNSWATLTNFPAAFNDAPVSFSQSTTNSPLQFYRSIMRGN